MNVPSSVKKAAHFTLDATNRQGRLSPGDRILFTAFGGGMNLAAALCTWSALPPKPPGRPATLPPRTHPAGRAAGRLRGRRGWSAVQQTLTGGTVGGHGIRADGPTQDGTAPKAAPAKTRSR
ncbi:3-oxoacyl-[acyl-carrier-protein] synthase III C-terminal domain-containing protein [Streptomyces sp. NPDC005811]|uniref:3-oxoacyl-[acyl-carrier-protein] synthase III C-terminal domain-containing protein n=1 Tax=Streptomyces sp. NPDC005811 TaxID=3154565 RepID=UPI0033E99186